MYDGIFIRTNDVHSCGKASPFIIARCKIIVPMMLMHVVIYRTMEHILSILGREFLILNTLGNTREIHVLEHYKLLNGYIFKDGH